MYNDLKITDRMFLSENKVIENYNHLLQNVAEQDYKGIQACLDLFCGWAGYAKVTKLSNEHRLKFFFMESSALDDTTNYLTGLFNSHASKNLEQWEEGREGEQSYIYLTTQQSITLLGADPQHGVAEERIHTIFKKIADFPHPIQRIPDELLVSIFGWCSIRDLGKLALVSQKFNAYQSSNMVWEQVAKRLNLFDYLKKQPLPLKELVRDVDIKLSLGTLNLRTKTIDWRKKGGLLERIDFFEKSMNYFPKNYYIKYAPDKKITEYVYRDSSGLLKNVRDTTGKDLSIIPRESKKNICRIVEEMKAVTVFHTCRPEFEKFRKFMARRKIDIF